LRDTENMRWVDALPNIQILSGSFASSLRAFA
jgi:hypothetical protein